MSNGIYDILGKLAALTPKEEPKQEQPQKVYESVEARGSILEGVKGIEQQLSEKYMGFKAVEKAAKKRAIKENTVSIPYVNKIRAYIETLVDQGMEPEEAYDRACDRFGIEDTDLEYYLQLDSNPNLVQDMIKEYKRARSQGQDHEQAIESVGVRFNLSDDDIESVIGAQVNSDIKEDIQADDGKHYRHSSDFFGLFDFDWFDEVVESTDGMELRGYLDGENVMAWRYDRQDGPRRDGSGYGYYDDSSLREGSTGDYSAKKAIQRKVREILSREVVDEKAAPGQEGWIKKNKQRFIKQYGKDKGLEVLYATAWKRSKQDESVNEAETDNFTIDDIKELEGIRDLATIKARAKELIKGKPARRMKPEKISWFYDHIDTLKNPMAVIKMMYDLLLAGEGHKVIGSRNSMGANSYRQRFGEDAEVCAECGMNEAECTCVHEDSDYGWDSPEEKKPAVRKITGKYGTEYQGDPEDDEASNGVGSASSGKKGRGRPRKHAIKTPKTDGNGNKLGRGRPKKATSTFAPGGLAAALGMGAAPKKHSKGRVHRMNESRMLDEAGEALQHILNRFKAEVKAFEQGADIDENLYDALYDYYVDLGEMPYGVQKARTGDPYNWVTQRLESELNITAESIDAEGVEECGATTAGAVAVAPERSLEEEMADLVELAKLAGIETEGNAFTDKLKSTPKGSEFELNGEVYTDTSNLDEADVEVSEPTEEPVNAPKKKYFSMRSSTMNPGEGDFGEKTMNPDRPTKNNGDNALSRPPVRESSLDLESKLAAEYESIKKISK